VNPKIGYSTLISSPTAIAAQPILHFFLEELIVRQAERANAKAQRALCELQADALSEARALCF